MTEPTRSALPLRALVERSSDGHLLVGRDGAVAYANVAARVILASDGDLPVGSEARRWVPDLLLAADAPLVEAETTMVSAKGDRFPAEVTTLPVDDGEGRFWIVFRDISRRKGMEGSVRAHAEELERMFRVRSAELERLRARWRQIYDHAPVLDIELDSEDAIASANRKACLSLGVPIDRLVGVPLTDVAMPDQRETLTAALRKMRDGAPRPYETRLRSTDGSILDVQLQPGEPGRETHGALRLVGLDVTARREAERLVDQSLELAEAQRARMERILRGIGEGVVVTDPDGQVRLMNGIAEQFLGIDEAFAFGRDLFAEQRDLAFTTEWTEFTAGNEDVRNAELKIGTGDRTFAVTMSRIRTPEGRPAGCVAVLRDVTQERRVERMKRDFVSNITHELRTPLASIRGFTTTILRGQNVEEGDRVRFLRIVEKEAERLQHLIEDLLTLSRLEDGRETLNLRPADLAHLLEDARAALAGTAQQRGITLDLAVESRNGSGIFDPDKIRRVIDNLVGNALKYTPAGGRVAIEMTRTGDRLEVAVRDTGRGIEPERLDRIFDRFYTVSAGQGNPNGTGLGLHIVRRLLELHGGQVEAESAPGRGSVFRASFPAVPRTVAPPVTRPAPAVAAGRPGSGAPAADPLVDDPDEAPVTSGSAPSGELPGVEALPDRPGHRPGREFPLSFPRVPGAPSLEEALTDDAEGPESDPFAG